MDRPIRVLHFQGRMGKGGAETFMMNTYRKINREKIQFDFLIYNDHKDVTPYNEEIFKLKGRIFSVPNPKKNIVGYIIAIKKLLKEETFDIVHNQVFFGGGLNLYLAYKANIKKRIAHSHATTDGKNSAILSLVRRPLDNLMFKYATDFLACSTEAGKGLFGEDKSFVFVPNGIDLEIYRQNSLKDIRKELNIPEDALVLGNIGRFEEQKNHLFIIKVFKELVIRHSNSHLILIGEGSLQNQIKKLADDLGLSKSIHFLGLREDIPDLLKAIDIFFMPSLYEGLPISAIEAQASGCKLVLSDKVSKETCLSSNVQFINLDAPISFWVDRILEKPFSNTPLPIMEKFNRENTAKIMQEIYLSKG